MSSKSKKKVTQEELRRLMNEQKKKLQSNIKKIEHPLAKYDKDGVLTCIVCETVVRSENVWSIHLNSKNHKLNVLDRVNKKEAAAPKAEASFLVPQSSVLKRPAPPEPSSSPPKKIKSILKIALPVDKKIDTSPSTETELSEQRLINEKENSNLEESHSDDILESDILGHDALPEGFFDDPKLDAKARNVEYKDPIEEEWEKFQREIKEETNKAQQIIADDQEEATTERQIDEIDEQIRNWSRVLTLEKKKENVSALAVNQNINKNDEELSDDDEFEEFLDWRSKKSFDYKLKNNVST